jgi:ABC-type transport system involved in multi-copper enzyme maturation permease subunit
VNALADARSSAPSPTFLVAKNVWLEIRRREEYFALVILIGLYVVFALIAKFAGATDAYSTSFMLNLGLSASSGLAAILTLVAAARQVPAELETKSIHTLLACPVSRTEFLIGKFLGTTVAGWFAFSLFVAVTWVMTRRLPEQDVAVFLQAFAVQAVGLAKLSAFTLLLSLLVPKAVALILSGAIFFGGVPLGNAFYALAPGGGLGTLMEAIGSFLGHLGQIPLFTRFTDGGPPLTWETFGLLLLQNSVVCLAALFLANLAFEKRRI